ncbi:MAG: hypothetical protein A2X67_15200 [Ignavibacteria bacterium GWA2_55_11]|nr:MAG: hypothetical protein A2X67_15200 [Ignavibacteria bacterium GWA2_55_11]OGU45303.1 MAG: hypothetical protein A2X68_01990 [Ignavibacteria bacterium GWC2_56_12]OGU62868.1 MAG: hypothetical protein A3C56_08665 [Ignavibacteria bacterium RIFCSPHIGHO2_02_FULL_56_12]OGU73600.1 MAG: hypothetical protein A3G43_00770 [Ignavibacteria bacterium RIFCSPLOWO2_12_FULL_56_21]OGU74097.1 MAG: hypothetical protein A3H45_06960 [Ignavibacteria bacterium RIFCSPLOWO2_02_FULL_55_14]HAV22883.1 hypothetical protei
MAAGIKQRPRDVDAYIAASPKTLQGKLRQLRSAIKKAAPDADEKISYGIPYYGLKGRLAYFRFPSRHIGLYIPPPVIQNHKADLWTSQSGFYGNRRRTCTAGHWIDARLFAGARRTEGTA